MRTPAAPRDFSSSIWIASLPWDLQPGHKRCGLSEFESEGICTGRSPCAMGGSLFETSKRVPVELGRYSDCSEVNEATDAAGDTDRRVYLSLGRFELVDSASESPVDTAASCDPTDDGERCRAARAASVRCFLAARDRLSCLGGAFSGGLGAPIGRRWKVLDAFVRVARWEYGRKRTATLIKCRNSRTTTNPRSRKTRKNVQ